MILSNVRFTQGLTAVATPTTPTAASKQNLGLTSSGTLPSTTSYAIEALMVGASPVFTLAPISGIVSSATIWVAGNAEVETATIVAAAGCTTNGTMTLLVTSAGMAGSPLSVVVPLTTTTHTTAALIAAAARTALTANATIAARFTVGGTSTAVSLTRKPLTTHVVSTISVPVHGATDGTLNINIPGGLGITAAASSANTIVGIATSGVYAVGSGKDFEGGTLPFLSAIHGLFMMSASGSVSMSGVGGSITAGGSLNFAAPLGGISASSFTVTGVAVPVKVSIVVSGS